jgi:hypothetical protein
LARNRCHSDVAKRTYRLAHDDATVIKAEKQKNFPGAIPESQRFFCQRRLRLSGLGSAAIEPRDG